MKHSERSWPTFIDGFFKGFGMGMAGQIALLFVVMPLRHGDAGDRALRDWRERQTEPQEGSF
jgi:hypothetical protein